MRTGRKEAWPHVIPVNQRVGGSTPVTQGNGGKVRCEAMLRYCGFMYGDSGLSQKAVTGTLPFRYPLGESSASED